MSAVFDAWRNWFADFPTNPQYQLALLSLAISVFIGFFLANWRSARSARQLQNVRESLSSREVGQFPEHLDAITDLIRSARKRIYVFADGVDYASFGAPERHDLFMAAILDALARGVEVTYLIWGPPAPISAANKFELDPEQFAEREDHYLAHLSTKEVRQRKYVSKFLSELEATLQACKVRPGWYPTLANVNLEMLNRRLGERHGIVDDALKALLLCMHEWVVRQFEHPRLANKARILVNTGASARPDLFFWLIDETEAIFLVPTDEQALAMRTRDPAVVAPLFGMFKARYRLYNDLKRVPVGSATNGR